MAHIGFHARKDGLAMDYYRIQSVFASVITKADRRPYQVLTSEAHRDKLTPYLSQLHDPHETPLKPALTVGELLGPENCPEALRDEPLMILVLGDDYDVLTLTKDF
jgi:hypothetical protein